MSTPIEAVVFGTRFSDAMQAASLVVHAAGGVSQTSISYSLGFLSDLWIPFLLRFWKVFFGSYAPTVAILVFLHTDA